MTQTKTPPEKPAQFIVHSSAGDPSDVANQACRLADGLESLAAHRRPSAAELADAPLLDRWSPAARMTPVFVGVVAGHPRLGSRRLVRTSEIFAIDSNQRWARTWSRFYRLGAAHSDGGLQRLTIMTLMPKVRPLMLSRTHPMRSRPAA